jgi:UDP-N-acetylglucosamine:LPS N-acetylglucosamine transferase
MATQIKDVVFLSASSGGGHNGTARAMVAWMERAGIEARFEIVDVYAGGTSVFPWLSRIRQRSNVIWRLFTAVMGFAPLLCVLRAIARPFVVGRCVRAIPRRPDLIVATHFVPAQFMREIAARFTPAPRTITVASDYVPHRAWFGNADLTVVSDAGVDQARNCGMDYRQLFPVQLLPASPTDASGGEASRGKGDALRICAVMGADGTSARRLMAVLDQLDSASTGDAGTGDMAAPVRIQVDVICGRNARLRERIARRAARFQHVTVNPLGFVNDVPLRLGNADVALIRASPLVLTEAAGQGRPVLAFDWHAHEGAVTSLLEFWGCGHASRSPRAVTRRLLEWARRPETLANARRKAGEVAAHRFDERTMRKLLNASARMAA